MKKGQIGVGAYRDEMEVPDALAEKFNALVEKETKRELNEALMRFFKEVMNSDGTFNATVLFGGKLVILKFVLSGEERFSADLNAFFRNTSIVSALIGNSHLSCLVSICLPFCFVSSFFHDHIFSIGGFIDSTK